MGSRYSRPGGSRRSGDGEAWAGAQRFSRDPASGWRSIRTLLQESDVTARIVQLVRNMYGPSVLPEAWDEFRCWNTDNGTEATLELTAESPFLEQFASWLSHTWTPAMLAERYKEPIFPEQVPSRSFLARHPDLDPLIAKYLNACIETPFSCFEVLNCEIGCGFSCCDLISGTQHIVQEGVTSTVLHPRQVLYARIVDVDGVAFLDAVAPWPVPEGLKPGILALGQEIFGHRSAGVASAVARQHLLVHEVALRSFYWGVIQRALKDNSLGPQLKYSVRLHKSLAAQADD